MAGAVNMPEDSVVVNSLAYRKNEDAIWRGNAPAKYTRIVPFVRGARVLEVGAAEGVLALLLAEAGKTVVALERRAERHADAIQLQNRWRALGRKVDGCKMVHGDIMEQDPNLLRGVDCLVAIRVIYHLRGNAVKLMAAAAAAQVPTIVLCGNKNRAARFEKGLPALDALGSFNYFSTIKGMSELLKAAGYTVQVVAEGDPIVIGTYRPRPSV